MAIRFPDLALHDAFANKDSMLMVSLLILLSSITGSSVLAESFSGHVGFYDADTLHVGEKKVRLFGIDAPEMDQTCLRFEGVIWQCGRWAAAEAKARFNDKVASCDALYQDRYGRTVARCFVDGKDVAEYLVRAGIAMSYRKYSLDYIDAEKLAVFNSRGIWTSALDAPSDYRASKQQASQRLSDGCRIKGNISSSGHIYHMPGQRFYERTQINPSKGERWFCSEADAVSAGWRKAIQ